MLLDVCLEGVTPPVGTLARFDDGGTAFVYHPDYLTHPGAYAISLSLPLSAFAHPDAVTRSFFQNLLQENDQLTRVLERERLDRDDVVGLLFHLGSDLAGALSCLPPGAPPIKVPGNIATDYDLLASEQLEDYVDRLANRRPLPDEARDPSPVAGVQSKLSLCFVRPDLAALPRPGLGVPTTHILKVPRFDNPREAALETMSARLAEACGFVVSAPRVQQFGEHQALVISRFDRDIAVDGTIRRIHQEDFAQALGLPPSLKYQRRGTEGHRFDATAVAGLLVRLAEPALAYERFLTATVFNLAIGNSDNHAKNHALLHAGNGAPSLAPLYDLVPVRLRDDLNPDFAFDIGTANRFEELGRGDIDTLLCEFGLVGERARRFKIDTLQPMLRRLRLAATRMGPGFEDFESLISRQIESLAVLLDLDPAIMGGVCA